MNLQNDSFAQAITWVPGMVWVSVFLSLLLLLIGWLWSMVTGFRSVSARKIRLFLAFPLTNPVALLVFLRRDLNAAGPAVACYLAAIVILWGGGKIAEWTEKRQLAARTAPLRQSGLLSMNSLIPEPVPDESNVWSHPFLVPIAVAGQPTSEGAGARAANFYGAIAVPPKDPRIDYGETDRRRTRRNTFADPLHELHEVALSVTASNDGALTESNTPTEWSQCGKVVTAHFDRSKHEFSDLKEAVNRPYDHYPYAWNEGFSMLLPHLSTLKAFTRSVALQTKAHASMRQPGEAFADLEIALRLIHTGDSDLLISRLVQMADTTMVLNAIRVAQQFHIWTDDQWRAIDRELAKLDFPALVPPSMRAERIFAATTIEPILAMRPSKIVTHIDQMGAGQAADNRRPPLIWLPVDAFCGGHGRAMLARQWLGCLEAYEELIGSLEETLEQSRSDPWIDCEVPPLSRGYFGYGMLARMLIPALENAFRKALAIQAQIELAQVAVALERYYLAHRSYPESLNALLPAYYNRPLRDPMDHQPWHYRTDGAKGFQLYTVGSNGLDDRGAYSTSGRDSERQDDVIWLIHSQLPPLPDFAFGTEAGGSGKYRMSKELMKRYGIQEAPPLN